MSTKKPNHSDLRCFYITYAYETNFERGNGSFGVSMFKHPSRVFLKEEAAKGTIFKADDVVITSVAEMSEVDYIDFFEDEINAN